MFHNFVSDLRKKARTNERDQEIWEVAYIKLSGEVKRFGVGPKTTIAKCESESKFEEFEVKGVNGSLGTYSFDTI